MKIAFLTTQTFSGSTVVGRILPLAQELAVNHKVHVLVHNVAGSTQGNPQSTNPTLHTFGRDPFRKTDKGKKRLSGITLIARMKWNAWLAFMALTKIKPDILVVSKALPESVLAATLYSIIYRPKVVLDVDDFELAANKLSSIWQRAAIHWSSWQGGRLTNVIATATPFLHDHFSQLHLKKKIMLVPTGVDTALVNAVNAGHSQSANTKTVLYLGSLSVASGHRVDLLPAIIQETSKTDPTIRFIIAGDGDDIHDLKDKCRKLGVSKSITWHGRFSANEIPSLMQAASVIIDPVDASLVSRAKSSFRATLAVATGHAVITSNIGIRSRLIPPDFHQRFFAKPEDTKDYTNKIHGILRNPLNDTEIQALQSHGKDFHWTRLAVQYQRILLSI